MGSLPILQVPTGWKMVVPSSPAAPSSLVILNATPGRYSSGWYFASALAAMMRRVKRMPSTATRLVLRVLR